MSNIPESEKRFKSILKGKIRKDLKKYIKSDSLIRKKGNDKISIPIHHIDIPKFRHGKGNRPNIGQGEGMEGEILREVEDSEEGKQKAGDHPGEHEIETEITLEELAVILQEELELPNIEPRGKKRIYTAFDRFHGLRRVGPDALMRFTPSYLEALKRELASGTYDFDNPIITITPDDKKFRSWKTRTVPESDAVIIYMMDVSGSMSSEHKTIARKISFWTDLFLRRQYKGIQSVYLIHDANAQEVDEHTFYHTTTSGGTRIASAYDLAARIIEKRFPPSGWNVYCFHYSDGDNWGDNKDEFKILRENLLPQSNLFCYGQIDLVPDWYRGYHKKFGGESFPEGKFYSELKEFVKQNKADNVATHAVKDEEGILDAIKTFLGKGK